MDLTFNAIVLSQVIINYLLKKGYIPIWYIISPKIIPDKIARIPKIIRFLLLIKKPPLLKNNK